MPTVHSERIRSGDPESSPAPVAAPVWRDSTAIDDATEASLRVRRFHLGHPSATSPPEELPLGLLPALLHRYRATPVRGDYPLFVAPGGEAREDPVCLSPREFLEKAARAGLDDSARTLKENLVRLERILRTVMGAQAGAAAAPEVMAESGRRLVSELSLAATETAELENQLRALSAALPENGIFLAYEPGVTMRLFALAARTRLHPRRRSFRLEVSRLLQEARGRLAADLGKVAGSDPARLGSSMGASATDLLDPAALSELLGPHRGTTVWGSERRARVERACQTLETFLTAPAGPLLIWISSGPPAASLDDVLPIVADDPCGAALHRFESEASELAQIFRATRLLTLELADRYDEQRHDPSLASFDWEAFTREELLLLPAVVADESQERIAGAGLPTFSRLLLAGRPVHVVVQVSPGRDPVIHEEKGADFRLELGYLGIGHRDAQVHQSSVARPAHLVRGLLSALDGTRAKLHVVSHESADLPLDPWLVAGAALESRAHPLFHYEPEAGATWARRLIFGDNPDPEGDWPTSSFAYTHGGDARVMELAFTFADFALLDPPSRPHFLPIPAGFPETDLVSVDEYLRSSPEDVEHRIPTVWAVDETGSLQRLAITKRLASVCRDRLEFWRTLQELAGIRNEHVHAAVERAEHAVREEAAAERARLEQSHASELARVREEATERGLEGLASFLLGLDPSDLPSGKSGHAGTLGSGLATSAGAMPAASGDDPSTPLASTEGASTRAEPPATTAPAEAAVEEGTADSWIDSALCTSCNDCTNINPRLFVYDGNKQARIGNLAAGTYAELVAAAEKCPARCIHPGEPLDSSEPDLPALRKRARPFQ